MTSYAQQWMKDAAGFNREVVEQFYNFLGIIYDEHYLTLHHIYNYGIQLCPKRN